MLQYRLSSCGVEDIKLWKIVCECCAVGVLILCGVWGCVGCVDVLILCVVCGCVHSINCVCVCVLQQCVRDGLYEVTVTVY